MAEEKKDSIEKSPDLDSKSGPAEITTKQTGRGECPTCGNEDLQSAELLQAWKDVEELEKKLDAVNKLLDIKKPIGNAGLTVPLNDIIQNKERAATSLENVDWKERYDIIKASYIKTRLEVSGSFGNWDYATKKRVLENEISKELGFIV